ncbi:hypothetical protein AM1_B0407 (plasmid) [Acaryochloris marina MBIC11017]|uniref:Uncharacterized protein n=1 Tax=Acaryochloris marina (strain MBIC 11017) TaxID=329726 RepID=A8ZLU8_ACAM1|nr:hypothetical protein [Acaryochloris marina]ABW32125.1 hypothetical protein AM1_B0407 [Acaryochloris marina MBIC11017]
MTSDPAESSVTTASSLDQFAVSVPAREEQIYLVAAWLSDQIRYQLARNQSELDRQDGV